MCENSITVRFFINRLSSKSDVLHYGRIRGWLEDEDERFSEQPLNRRAAARILHQYLKIELGIPDLADVSSAEMLKDLYTCRVCANHIAQIYARGIMDCREIEHCGKIVQIFDQLGLVTEGEAAAFVESIRLLGSDVK